MKERIRMDPCIALYKSSLQAYTISGGCNDYHVE